MSIRSNEGDMKSDGRRRDRNDFSLPRHWRWGCPEGYHLPHDRELGDIRLVVPVPDAILI